MSALRRRRARNTGASRKPRKTRSPRTRRSRPMRRGNDRKPHGRGNARPKNGGVPNCRSEGKERCPHARPAVIALGEGQGTFLHVCIAKKTCQKHWGKPKAEKNAIPTDAEIEADAARKRQEAAWARQRAAEERWRTELQIGRQGTLSTRAPSGNCPW